MPRRNDQSLLSNIVHAALILCAVLFITGLIMAVTSAWSKKAHGGIRLEFPISKGKPPEPEKEKRPLVDDNPSISLQGYGQVPLQSEDGGLEFVRPNYDRFFGVFPDKGKDIRFNGHGTIRVELPPPPEGAEWVLTPSGIELRCPEGSVVRTLTTDPPGYECMKIQPYKGWGCPKGSQRVYEQEMDLHGNNRLETVIGCIIEEKP